MGLSRLTSATCALAVAGLLVSGCGQHRPNALVASQAHLNVGVLNAIDCAAAHIAAERGYFAAEGLSVDIKAMPSGLAVLPALQSGGLDIGYGNYVSYFTAEARGAKLHIAADGYQLGPEVQPVIALPNAGIRTPRDLAGKRIAVQLTNNIQTLLINEMVKAYGVDPTTLHYVTMPFPQMGEALKKGQVDAASMVEPFTTQNESTLGAQVVADLDSGATKDAPIGGYVSTEAWAATHAKTLAAFRRAMARAAVDAAQRPIVQEVLVHDNKVDPKTAAILRIGVYPTSVNAARLTRIVDLMAESGLLTGPVDVARMTS